MLIAFEWPEATGRTSVYETTKDVPATDTVCCNYVPPIASIGVGDRR